MRWLIPLLITLLLYSCGNMPAYACFQDCSVDDTGYTLIKNFEGYSPFVYKDAVGIPTIGFGHVIQPGEDIRIPLMGPQAVKLLEADIDNRVGPINRMVMVPLNSNQFDALASFAYNVGTGSLKRSTLLKKVNAGAHDQVYPQFLQWDKAGGKVLQGLRLRRKAEAMLYNY